MLAKIWSSAVVGLEALLIEVEVDISSGGLPAFNIVGLPNKAVEESKERVRSAIKNSGATFPAKRITINLAPADLPKEGPSYDLPMAIGILIASEQLKADVSKFLFTGELSLDGKLRFTSAILPQAILAKEEKFAGFFIPKINAREASSIKDLNIYPCENLTQIFLHLIDQVKIEKEPFNDKFIENTDFIYDFKDIKGQEQAKRALEISAAGGHNVLFKGPPGAGKTLLARTLPSILPKMTFEEMVEVTKIYSISGLLKSNGLISNRPFRAPHHSTSHAGLIGGGTIPKPGDITLAHRGVLFLDEVPEFQKSTMEALRQPLEDGFISIARAQGRIVFPAKFILIGALNPCPCGYFGDPTHKCSCQILSVFKYQKKISGPILDRIDIHLDVPAVKTESLTEDIVIENSQAIKNRVQAARDIQNKRYENLNLVSNSELKGAEIKKFCALDNKSQSLLKMAVLKMKLSARSYYRIIKLSRTIADLDNSENIRENHIAEALQYRPKN